MIMFDVQLICTAWNNGIVGIMGIIGIHGGVNGNALDRERDRKRVDTLRR